MTKTVICGIFSIYSLKNMWKISFLCVIIIIIIHKFETKVYYMKKFERIAIIAATGITTFTAGIMGSKNIISKLYGKKAAAKIKTNPESSSKTDNHISKVDTGNSESSKENQFYSKTFTDEILFATIDCFEKKMPYSRGHSKRVANISKALGEKLGVEDLDGLYYAALLHDIGKLFIPDELMTKSKLNMSESERLRWYDHPKLGAKFVKSIGSLSKYAGAIEHHHERYDGGGYPDNLLGDEIPLFSRIIGVADAYEAMSSERPGREAYPREYIMSEFSKCSGKQFDPKVVKAMMSVIADISI